MLASTPLSNRDRRVAITAAITCVAVVGIGLSLSIPLLSLEMERMGASSTMIGLNTAVAGVATFVTVPFVPRLAARVGALPLLALSILSAAALLLGFRLLYDLAWWFPLRFLFSVALGALFVLSEYWIAQAAPPERRGLVMGVYATVLALGFAVGPGLLVFLGTRGSAPYLAGAALILFGLLPLWPARRLGPHLAPGGGSRGIPAYLRIAPAATLAALLYGAVETGGFAILPLYGLRLGLDTQTAAGLVSAVALGNVLFQVPVGWLADRIDRGRVLLAAGLGGALGAALLPLASGSLPVLAALLFVWGGTAGTLYTVGLSQLGASVRGSELAGANAAFVALYAAGLTLGPPLIGAGMDLVEPQGFALVLAGLFLAYAGAVAASRSRASRAADRDEGRNRAPGFPVEPVKAAPLAAPATKDRP